jgi:hypothetical protein
MAVFRFHLRKEDGLLDERIEPFDVRPFDAACIAHNLEIDAVLVEGRFEDGVLFLAFVARKVDFERLLHGTPPFSGTIPYSVVKGHCP